MPLERGTENYYSIIQGRKKIGAVMKKGTGIAACTAPKKTERKV